MEAVGHLLADRGLVDSGLPGEQADAELSGAGHRRGTFRVARAAPRAANLTRLHRSFDLMQLLADIHELAVLRHQPATSQNRRSSTPFSVPRTSSTRLWCSIQVRVAGEIHPETSRMRS